MSKKIVLDVDICDERQKQKVMHAVTSLKGIDSLAMDMEQKKLTVIGSVNPVDVVGKLKKWNVNIDTVGPSEEEEEEDEKEEDDKHRRCYTYYPPY